MRIAFSPCPNDTFLFGAWVLGLTDSPPCQPHLADIEQLNQWAVAGDYPLIKVSVNCVRELVDRYAVLPVGAALGHGVGPKLVARESFPLEELTSKRVAVPGKRTTAHRLLELLTPKPVVKHFCLYHEVFDLLRTGVVDAGLIIHEQRFTFAEAGFVEICDLGEHWEKAFELPLPLGCLVARRNVQQIDCLIADVRASLRFAQHHPTKIEPYILQHSQEMAPNVVAQHIQTYVNRETEELSPVGIQSIEELLGQPAREWLWGF